MDNRTPSATGALLEVSGLHKSFGGVHALRGASLSLEPGEVHALVGENGAGKSTLIKVIAGLVRPDAASILFRGESAGIDSAHDATRLGLSFIHQELNLVPYFRVAENVFLGKDYPKNTVGLIDRRELDRRAGAALAALGVSIPLGVVASRLSRGEQAMTAIARAFTGDAALYVMDEPTASLTDVEIARLFDVIARLKAKGKTILYVSHRLDEIFSICDRVTVMRDGQTVGSMRVSDTDPASLIRMMIGRNLADSFPPACSVPGADRLVVEDLDRGRGRTVSFSLRAGEILGVAGLAGSGRSSLLKAIGGALCAKGGRMSLDGKPYSPANPRRAIDSGVVLVPEERREQGLVLGRSVRENIALPNLRRLSSLGVFVRRLLEDSEAAGAAAGVRLKAASLGQKAGQLSGGNQQKVVFAKWLLGRTEILLLDEPTRGVDVGARFEIYRIVREMAAKGVGIILASSDLSEVLGMADRVMVLRDGGLEAMLPGKDLDQETVLRHCYGEGGNQDGR
ncbi:MAG: sugar ABC transporter ATP-binding protein [Spirochaetota bacterium]